MKRKIIAVIAAAMAVCVFASCSSGSSDDGDVVIEAGEEYSVADEELSDEEAESIFAEDEDMLEEEEINLDDFFPDLADISDDETEEDLNDDIIEDESSNPLRPIADRALSESEWPFMDEVSDSVFISEFFTLDPENSNYRELLIMQCPMSASMSEIIIIEADDVDSAKADLEARQTKAIETDAWYPHDQELAAASIVGVNGSYAYFIIGDNAAAAEESINAYISENA